MLAALNVLISPRENTVISHYKYNLLIYKKENMEKKDLNKASIFKRILVANRGEIAVRIIRTIKKMGYHAIAIYSEDDANSLHVQLADFAYFLEGQKLSETYLNINQIISAINVCDADAVHPGYGFLSENEKFRAAVDKKTKAVFIGPSLVSMQVMGNKISARKLMEENAVPTVPGCNIPIENESTLYHEAKKIGYPLMIKAAAGGGGRGMRIAYTEDELINKWQEARREAEICFNDSSVFCERYITSPRHIEVQVLSDEHQNYLHLFERECSIQRRHQKLFEEAPSSYLNDQQRDKICQLSIKIAKLVNYIGVGTIEFICESPEKAYFMEMNTRIQVEHPITEVITGIDLIRQQILVAEGRELEFTQNEIKKYAFAMEARINSEDPNNDFMPTNGNVTKLHLPAGPFTRVDSHLYQNYKIPTQYDSLLAKIITWGKTREEARIQLKQALSEFQIEGITTTCSYLSSILDQEDFINCNTDTNFITNQKLLLIRKKERVRKAKSKNSLYCFYFIFTRKRE